MQIYSTVLKCDNGMPTIHLASSSMLDTSLPLWWNSVPVTSFAFLKLPTIFRANFMEIAFGIVHFTFSLIHFSAILVKWIRRLVRGKLNHPKTCFSIFSDMSEVPWYNFAIQPLPYITSLVRLPMHFIYFCHWKRVIQLKFLFLYKPLNGPVNIHKNIPRFSNDSKLYSFILPPG